MFSAKFYTINVKYLRCSVFLYVLKWRKEGYFVVLIDCLIFAYSISNSLEHVQIVWTSIACSKKN